VRRKFKLRGKEFELSREKVMEILKDKSFEQNGSRYFIELEGRYIPIKEALNEVLKSEEIGLTKLDFTTQDAVRIFRKLGFEIFLKGKREKALDDLVGAIKEGGNFDAVEDKMRLYE